MTQFEGSDHSWEQMERYRHASLLRQLKAELQEFRRKTLSSTPDRCQMHRKNNPLNLTPASSEKQ